MATLPHDPRHPTDDEVPDQAELPVDPDDGSLPPIDPDPEHPEPPQV